jgi:bacterioferritin
MATGGHGKSVANEFKEHADAEREHADGIAERIQQLGGKPDFNPRNLLERSAAQYVEGETLADMIREDLIAERVVIQVYTEMIRHFGDDDPTTRVLMEGILKDEEEHATDLTDLLYIVDPASGRTEGQDPGTQPLKLHPEKGEQGRREPERAGEKRAARQVAGRGSAVAPEHEPGTTGRPTRQRPQATTQAEEGAQARGVGMQRSCGRAHLASSTRASSG